MTVNITLSDESGGNSLSDTQDSGTVVPGNESDFQDVFIRHDAAVNPITDCAWYVTRCVSTTYQGSDPDADLIEILGWGDGGSDGFVINQVIPVAWTIGDQFAIVNDDLFKNSHGDENTQIQLPTTAINIGTPAGAGQIPVAGEAHVQFRWKTPSSVTLGSGYRGLTVVFAYSATS